MGGSTDFDTAIIGKDAADFDRDRGTIESTVRGLVPSFTWTFSITQGPVLMYHMLDRATVVHFWQTYELSARAALFVALVTNSVLDPKTQAWQSRIVEPDAANSPKYTGYTDPEGDQVPVSPSDKKVKSKKPKRAKRKKKKKKPKRKKKR